MWVADNSGGCVAGGRDLLLLGQLRGCAAVLGPRVRGRPPAPVVRRELPHQVRAPRRCHACLDRSSRTACARPRRSIGLEHLVYGRDPVALTAHIRVPQLFLTAGNGCVRLCVCIVLCGPFSHSRWLRVAQIPSSLRRAVP